MTKQNPELLQCVTAITELPFSYDIVLAACDLILQASDACERALLEGDGTESAREEGEE